jgi:hypothetical protein
MSEQDSTDQSEAELTFPEISYDDTQLRKLWSGIKEHFGPTGRVYSKDIAEKTHEYQCTYDEQTIVRDILPKLRKSLKQQNMISVELEDADQQGPTRKKWIFENLDNSSTSAKTRRSSKSTVVDN